MFLIFMGCLAKVLNIFGSSRLRLMTTDWIFEILIFFFLCNNLI